MVRAGCALSSGAIAAPSANQAISRQGSDPWKAAPDGPDLAAAPQIAGLTPRQVQVLHLVPTGHPDQNIAIVLDISQRTVENHRAAIMRRSGATSQPALARMAVGWSEVGVCRWSDPQFLTQLQGV